MKTITTLDGKEWDVKELVEEMRNDDFYYGYMGINSLSSSAVKDLLKSPKMYSNKVMDIIDKQSQPVNDSFSEGRLIHQLILEPEKHFDWNIIDAKDKRSKEWKEALLSETQNTILKKDYDKCKSIADAFIANSRMSLNLAFSDKEVPNVVEIEGIPFRVKADMLSEGVHIYDLKTTANIYRFNKWTCMDYGYDCQVYIYCKAFNLTYKDFVFLVIDKANLEIGEFNVSEELYLSGESKVLQAIEVYKEYFLNMEKDLSQHYHIGVV